MATAICEKQEASDQGVFVPEGYDPLRPLIEFIHTLGCGDGLCTPLIKHLLGVFTDDYPAFRANFGRQTDSGEQFRADSQIHGISIIVINLIAGVKPHRHPEVEHFTFYGDATLVLGEEGKETRMRMRKGSHCVIPANTRHSVELVDNQPCWFFVLKLKTGCTPLRWRR